MQEPDIEDEDASAATDCPASPKYTTLEKCIMDRQKRKLVVEKTWAMKQQKTEEKKIAVCSAKLKVGKHIFSFSFIKELHAFYAFLAVILDQRFFNISYLFVGVLVRNMIL